MILMGIVSVVYLIAGILFYVDCKKKGVWLMTRILGLATAWTIPAGYVFVLFFK